MEENAQRNPEEQSEQAPPTYYFQSHEPRVRIVLLGLLASCLLFAMVGAIVFQAIALAAGWGTDAASGILVADAEAPERWQFRLLLGLGQLFTFLIGGWVALQYFYPPVRKMLVYARAERIPNVQFLLTGIVLILVAAPLVLFMYNINQALPLPEFMRMMEAQTNESIKGLLQMDNALELLANLTLIALLPALGEELVFRAGLQNQLMRRMGPWVAIVLGAAIFSFIHFQFEGFLPRVLLGVLLGWLYWRSGNLWVPVGAHFVNNAFQVVGQYLYGKELSTVDLEQDIDVPWYAAAISALIIFAIIWRREQQHSITSNDL